MSHILNNGEESGPIKLELVKFRILGKPYSKWRAIITEATGESDTLFRMALLKFGIKVETDLDPTIYIVQDTNQMRQLAEEGIGNPTMLQLLLSTKWVSLSEQDAIDMMNAWLEAHKATI